MLLVPSIHFCCLLLFRLQAVYVPLRLVTLGTACLCEEEIEGISDQRKTTFELYEDYRSLQICMHLNQP